MAGRPDLYVLARLLQRLNAGDAVGRGELQLAARLNYDLLRRYLDHLLTRGLVQQIGSDGRKVVYKITPAGHAAYQSLLSWIEEWVGGL